MKKVLLMSLLFAVVGCDNDYEIAHTIPGAKGAKGDVGATGPMGPAGADGKDAELPEWSIVESFNPCQLKKEGLQLIHRLSNGKLMSTSPLKGGPSWTSILTPGIYKTADGYCKFEVTPSDEVKYLSIKLSKKSLEEESEDLKLLTDWLEEK